MSQYDYPQQYPQYPGQPQFDPLQYNQPQGRGDAPIFPGMPGYIPGIPEAPATQPKPPAEENQGFWDQAVLAALGGVAGEVRLTSDAIVAKAVACAEKLVEYRIAYVKGETPGQLAKQKAEDDEKKAKDAADKKAQADRQAKQEQTDAAVAA